MRTIKLATDDFKGFRLKKTDIGNNADIEECEYSESVEASFTTLNSLHVIGSNDKSFFLQVAGGNIEENSGV